MPSISPQKEDEYLDMEMNVLRSKPCFLFDSTSSF